MKNILKVILVLTILFLPTKINAATNDQITVHYFWETYCANCAEVSEFLDDEILGNYNINLVKYNVAENNEDYQLFLKTTEAFDVNAEYPMMVIGGTILQGTTSIKSNLAELIEYYEEQTSYSDIVDKLVNGDTVLASDFIENPFKTVDLPIIGEIDRTTFSLTLGAIVIGLIDGFNPCAMWVLIFLITMLINLKDRKRIWILGLTFIFTSGLIYYIIMMSWLQIVVNVLWHQAFQIIIGAVAITFAFFSIRHYWKARQQEIGCEVTTSEQRSKLMTRIKSVISKNNLWLAIIGIIGVAITVNLLELACSAGLPVIYSSMLAFQDVTQLQSALYILLYVFFFMLDDIIVFTIAVITLKVTGISNKYAKYSNLVGGLIMLFIGLALIFFPSLLF